MAPATRDIGPVVVGIDGSEASLLALRHAAREAGWRGVGLHVVHALDISPAVLHLANDKMINTRELAESDRDEVWKTVASALEGFDGEMTRVDLDGSPGPKLIDYCRESGASVVVVGPRGRGRMVDALLGSTAQQVIRDARCDVLVVKSPDA